MLVQKFRKLVSGAYLRNVGWMAAAEASNRVIRLGSTVILARVFSTQDYGLMAIIFTASDLAQVFMLRGGVGAKIIQVDGDNLSPVCNTAYWLNWISCGVIFLVQSAIAFTLPYFSHDSSVTWPLFFAGLSYLTYPLFTVPLVLMEREHRFKDVARFNVIISLATNVITATLVLAGMGIWAIVLAMLLASPVWIFLTWRAHSWRPPMRFRLEQWQDVLGFGSNLLVNSLLSKVRANVDYLLVGRFLGIEALGLYYFAFNAGSGITMSILNTFMSPLYPFICEVREDYYQFRQRYSKGIKQVSLALIPMIVLQVALAPVYVPIVFGEKWIPAIPILMLVSLSVIPRIYAWSSTLLLSAINKTKISLKISFIFTSVFIAAILATVQQGIVWVALAVCLANFLISLPISLWVHIFVFRKQRFKDA